MLLSLSDTETKQNTLLSLGHYVAIFGHYDNTPHSQKKRTFLRDPFTNFQIQRAETIAEAHTAMVEASDNLNMLGALCNFSTLEERHDLIKAALTYYLEGRMAMPLKQ